MQFFLGALGALIPLAVFLAGVAWLGLTGAPDERGLWPILLAALTTGLLLARNRADYAEAVLGGMSQKIVMLMVMAWMLAGVFGSLMSAGGLVEALVQLAGEMGVSGGGFVAATFLICCAVSTATGTSIGTILLCAPLLYPPAGALGAEPAWAIGAVVAGATFGDNISPVSDTTIASATTQGADLGGVVRSRVKYAAPAALASLILYLVAGGGSSVGSSRPVPALGDGGLLPLAMLVAPVVAVGLLLARRHLLEGLIMGILTALAVGLLTRLIAPTDVLFVDQDAFIARGLILDGMERGVGVSVFTILLMGLVGGFEASGLLTRMVAAAARRMRSARGAEAWIFGVVSGAVLLTTHSVVAILSVGKFADETGKRFGVGAYRRANILDMTVCTYPFLFPFFIPTILAASMTTAGADFGMPRLSAWEVGWHNLYSWGLLGIVLVVIMTGWGRRASGGEAEGNRQPRM